MLKRIKPDKIIGLTLKEQKNYNAQRLFSHLKFGSDGYIK